MRARYGMVALALVGACAGAEDPRAVIRLAVDDDTCARYCAVRAQAQVFREDDPDQSLPLGPAERASCGEDLSFEALPAGHRVFVAATLYDDAGDAVLSGVSDVVTIVADGVVEPIIALNPASTPTVVAVAPDPLVIGDDSVTVTLSGSDFGLPLGDFGVDLDAAPLAVSSWDDDAISATLTPGAAGSAVTIRRCGIASAAAPLRVASQGGFGSTPVQLPPGCDGLRFVAAASAGQGDAFVAAQCDDATKGYIQRLAVDSANCPLLAGDAFSLGANPVAVSVDANATTVWAALGDTGELAAIDVASGGQDAVALPDGGSARAVVAISLGEAYAVGAPDDNTTVLYRVAGDTVAAVEGVTASLSLGAVAATADFVFVVGAPPDGPAKLVGVPRAGGPVVEWSLAPCRLPAGLATSPGGAWVATACADPDAPGVLAFGVADSELVRYSLAGGGAVDGLAFDGVGDVLLVRDAGRAEVSVLALDQGALTRRVSWAAPAGSEAWMARVDAAHRFIVPAAEPGALAVWTPYDQDGPCEAAP